jgi:TonB family protein
LADHSAYFNRVKNKIDNRWVAVGTAGERSVTLLFNLRKDGSVDAVEVEESSGDRLFDLAAQRAIGEAVPLPPFPPGMTDRSYRIHYRFTNSGKMP